MAQSRDHIFWSRLGVTLVVLGAYCLGTNLPLPGLDGEKVAALLHVTGPAALDRVSILSLGITPLLNALILVELLKLIAPGVRAWEVASVRNRDRLGHIVIGLALLLALIQAAGIAAALEGVAGLVAEPGNAFRFVCIATLMAGAALAMAFAHIIDRAGLGSGLWLLFLTPALVRLPSTLAQLAVLNAHGEYGTQQMLLGLAFSALTIAGIVAIVRSTRAAPETVAICIWTPFVANAILTLVLFGLGWLATTSIGSAAALATPGYAPWYAMLAVVVVLTVALYERSYARAGVERPVPAAPIAATIAAILIAGAILEAQLGVVLPLGTSQLIVAAAVATVFLIDWGFVKPSTGQETTDEISPRA